MAAIVASQTMITATFQVCRAETDSIIQLMKRQLLSQIIKLSYFPQIKLTHTSKIFHGQIYIPWANWLLMIGTVIVTIAYSNVFLSSTDFYKLRLMRSTFTQTTELGQAYGVCVILVTFITTSMVALVAIIIWRLPITVVAIGFLVFGALDGLYLSSAFTKVPQGAWFTLLLAVLLSSVFILWRFGKENQWHAEASDRIPPSRILTSYENNLDGASASNTGIVTHHGLRLTSTFGGAEISPIKGLGIFFDKTGSSNSTPTVFVHFLQKFQAAPAVVVFFHMRPLSSPTVALEERFTVTRCFPSSATSPALQNVFRITLRHGYTDEAITRDLGAVIYEQLRNFVIRDSSNIVAPNASSTTPEKPDSTSSSSNSPPETIARVQPSSQQQQQLLASQRLAALESAYADQVVYVVGKEQMRIREDGGIKGWMRRITLSAFLWLRGNTGSKVANMNIDVDKLVEVGFVKVI